MKKGVVIFLHIGYWLIYALLLTLFYAIMRSGMPNVPPPMAWFWLMLEFAVVPGVLAFYIFYSFLLTHFLSRRKILQFILAALAVAMLSAAAGEVLMYSTFSRRINWTLETIIGMGVVMTLNALLNGLLGLVMRGFISWYNDIKVKEDLSKKNYETELALIKSQINPHFLFNTLNNIDVLILKDPEKASEYLNKLSDIMRFMLYETKTEKVPLSRELEYIEKYIALQKIRTANPHFVNYSVSGEYTSLMIEPMLFIPFIENAFKHAENKNIENAITIGFVLEKDKITFVCRNYYPGTKQTRPDYGGLGNELIRKRLALIYPGRHKLHITNEDHNYQVNIELLIA